MQTIDWQKSTYSGDGSNCVYVAATPTGQVYLRESDDPDTILVTTHPRLQALIQSLKNHPSPARRRA
ncbi:DUF397 domain-containing protein [Streptomyces aurantiacus]|uniref:DUF397 domain-containing protein n=1 Tax=Streptomyces aurantiacus TaxID=47760 RepID=A0A7G1P959_9ACTN|nr:DUF397 domain-containing protein [Streptomyces aurantiacus]BCL30257.1 hypothetical protein GCM10017557_51160 [Streptomyces aurantiacus]